MRLRKLTAVTFRNYEQLEFVPHPGCTVLCGRNGHGKTNVLEAVTLLSTARSHRGARDRELTRWGAQGYRLDGTFADTERELRTVLVFDGSIKRVECDDVVQERLSAVLGRTPVSVFSPEDLALVKGGPADRRRFLDMNLSQLSAAYLADLQTYTRALKQRNRALQDWCAGRGGRDAVNAWDGPLLDAGSRIHVARAEYVNDVSVEAARVYGIVSGARECLAVAYVPSIPDAAMSAEVAAHFGAELERLAGRERSTGTTPCGPHRDDVRFLLNGQALREFGSQGQHRSAVLALKLAEGAIMMRRSTTEPITLLDDFASELDEMRQAAILEMVCSRGQVLITTTELTGPLHDVQEKLVLCVEEGTMQEAGA